MKRIYLIFASLLAFSSISLFASINAPNHFRRHFLVFFDTSGEFLECFNRNQDLKKSIIKLFENRIPEEISSGNFKYIAKERNNNIKFFIPESDQISFYQFGLTTNEYSRLKDNSDRDYILNKLFQKFVESFINYNEEWSNFDLTNSNRAVSDFFKKMIINKKTSNYTLSDLVYPCGLFDKSFDSYSSEYVIIIISDFLSGSVFGNRRDFEIIRNLYNYNENYSNAILDHIETLKSKFYTIDYFQFAIPTTCRDSHNEPIYLGLIAYKLKPMCGSIEPENIIIKFDSDVSLEQDGYLSPKFHLPLTKVNFTHGDNLILNGIHLAINDIENRSELFNSLITEKQADQTTLNLINGKSIIYDDVNWVYSIPSIKLPLSNITTKRSIGDKIDFAYYFDTKYLYNTISNSTINYTFTTSRTIGLKGIQFSTKAQIIIMQYLIPLLTLIIVIIIIVYLGKPKGIITKVSGYLDSYQIIDHREFGKLLTDYKYWNTETDEIPVKGNLIYQWPKFLFNWKPEVYIEIEESKLPKYFEVSIKQDSDSLEEYYKGHALAQKIRNHSFGFVVFLRNTNHTLYPKINSPQLARITIKLYINKKKLFFIKSVMSKKIQYQFHLGPDLKDIWVGFDPGTTGSCIAAGNSSENIMLEKKVGEKNDKITPSIISFDTTKELSVENPNGQIPLNIYRYGSNAERRIDIDSDVRFQSIKKLLGFKNAFEVQFSNKTREFNGSQLTSLLIDGIYKDLKLHIERNSPDHLIDNEFMPRRAVTAIPNNFTLNKIQDLIDAFQYIKAYNKTLNCFEPQFTEIRYVYEAEAVLFYYLSNYKEILKNASAEITDENVLIFDMGGATINATVVSCEKRNDDEFKNKSFYDIDIKGKIGYGIGGDTIDYCIIKLIFDHLDEFPELIKYNPFTKISIDLSHKERRNAKILRAKYQQIALGMKKIIIKNYAKKVPFLIQPVEIEDIINKNLGTKISIRQDGNFISLFSKKGKSKCHNIFEHRYFKEYIYNNIIDAIKEVVISCDEYIDTVIFSGRSIYFPLIQDTVMNLLSEFDFNPLQVVFPITESKTIVAKGACWYGINKNGIRLNNLKTIGSFGIKRSKSVSLGDVEFINLINMGMAFDSSSEEIGSFEGQKVVNSNFAFDGGKVNFYQIMSNNPESTFANNAKHKYSKITGINIPLIAKAVKIKVFEDDNIKCAVKLVNNRVIDANGFVKDQDVSEENEEHYTWLVE